MKNRKKLKDSDWRFSVMALGVCVGASIAGQLMNLSHFPNLPSIYGALTGFVLLVAGNVIYVFFKRKKNENDRNK